MIDVDKTTFEEEVLKADGYVFVDFYGDGCVPCQALMPKVHEFAETYGDKLKFTSLNTTKARRLAISQKVLGLPVMAIYKDGEKVEELVKDDCTAESIEAFFVLGDWDDSTFNRCYVWWQYQSVIVTVNHDQGSDTSC